MLSTISSWNNLLAKLGFHKQRSAKRGSRNHFARGLHMESMEARRLLATLTVNSSADTHINTDGVLSLRNSLIAENLSVYQGGGIEIARFSDNSLALAA